MIALLLQCAGAIGIGAMLGLLARAAEKAHRRKVAAYDQRQWDAHVDQAVKVSETPLYERIAFEFAKNIDLEWERVSTGGWATE